MRAWRFLFLMLPALEPPTLKLSWTHKRGAMHGNNSASPLGAWFASQSSGNVHNSEDGSLILATVLSEFASFVAAAQRLFGTALACEAL